MRCRGFITELGQQKWSVFVGWLLVLVCLVMSSTLSAATVTWDGGAGTGTWADGVNWDTNTVPVAGDDLVFAGSTQLSTTNNIATVDISFNSITFAAAAGAFTLAGSRITLAGNITNSSSNTQAINIPMILDVATCTITATSNISVGGVVSETGGARALTKAGAGTLYLATNNTYSGTTTVNAGTLQNATLNNTTYGTGGITLNGGTLLVDRIALANNITNSNASSVIIMDNGWGSSISGTITNNALLSVQAWYATQTFSGNISGTGGITLTQLAGGTLTLSGTNSYSGATTISSGTLKAGSTSAFGTNSAVTLANVATAILDITGFNNSIGSLAGGGATGGNVTLGTTTLTLGGDGTSTSYDGVISGTGAVTKTGTGTQTLTRANTYTGATTISGGTLKITATSYATPSFSIATGTVLEFNLSSNADYGTTTFSGAGTLRKSGSAAISWQAAVATFQLSSGALIDVVAGTFTGGSWANEVWTSNLSDLTVASGATFVSTEANTMVNAINGAGTIASGYPGRAIALPLV